MNEHKPEKIFLNEPSENEIEGGFAMGDIPNINALSSPNEFTEVTELFVKKDDEASEAGSEHSGNSEDEDDPQDYLGIGA